MQSEPLILVVEDNTILRRVIVDALEERGYRIESAADFPEGAIKLRAAAPALLIADVNLPNGDGRNLWPLLTACLKADEVEFADVNFRRVFDYY